VLAAITLVEVAQASEVKTIIFRRSTHAGIEEMGFSFQGKEVRLTNNSNFLMPQKQPVMFGLFTAQKDAWLSHLERLADHTKKVSIPVKLPQLPAQGASDYQSPHRIQVLVNGVEVAPTSDEAATLLATARATTFEVKWKAIDAVVVRPKVGNDYTVEYLACDKSRHKKCLPIRVSCKDSNEPCRVGDFGYFWR